MLPQHTDYIIVTSSMEKPLSCDWSHTGTLFYSIFHLKKFLFEYSGGRGMRFYFRYKHKCLLTSRSGEGDSRPAEAFLSGGLWSQARSRRNG